MGLFQSMVRIVVGIDVLLLLLLAFSFAFLEPGTGSYVVAVLTLVPVCITLLGGIATLKFDWDPF